MTPRKIITAWTDLGRWHKDPGPPNGCCPSGAPQRWCETVTVFQADYYGNGLHVYLDSQPIFQTAHGAQHMPGGSCDGHPDRIAKRMQEAGVSP